MQIRNLAFALTMLASLAVAAAPLSGAAATAGAQDPYEAVVTKAVKQVEWQRHRTSRWQKARLETLLLVGDTIRTGTESHAELLYGDGSVTRVGSLTSLTLTGDRKREIRLESGKVWLKIRKSGAGMRVITPGAVAAVTGTELLVEFDPVKKTTEVTVFEGAVNVTGDVGELVKVLGGRTTMVPFKAPAMTPLPIDNRKLQERNTIFKPLSVEGDQPKQPDSKQPESKQPETKQPDNQGEAKQPDGQAEAKQPDGQAETKQPDSGSQSEAKQPEVTPEVPTAVESTAPAQPVANDPPKLPESAPSAAPPAVEPDKKAVGPDLKGQVKELNDPRLINGSPTTGSVRVIIE